MQIRSPSCHAGKEPSKPDLWQSELPRLGVRARGRRKVNVGLRATVLWRPHKEFERTLRLVMGEEAVVVAIEAGKEHLREEQIKEATVDVALREGHVADRMALPN